ncbi:MAG: ABC transporter ATP-binding protein, partial [Clostridia bacterium]|nr:ABC transporter ATP-binding protein [Clostridia bacterium]
FIADPPILLLDEPLTALDVVMVDEMKRLLKRRKQSHITILSTHIMELALDICDDIVILHNGVLSPVSRDQLNDAAYKDRIIAALKEESND